MTGSWYGNGLYGLLSATAGRRVDWVGHDIKVALTTSSHTIDKDAHDFFNDITNEITGTGYTAGGVTLGSKTLTYDTATDEVRADAADAQWTSSSFTAAQAHVYCSTPGSAATNPLLGYIDFGGNEQVTSGTFTIQFASTGVLVLDAT